MKDFSLPSSFLTFSFNYHPCLVNCSCPLNALRGACCAFGGTLVASIQFVELPDRELPAALNLLAGLECKPLSWIYTVCYIDFIITESSFAPVILPGTVVPAVFPCSSLALSLPLEQQHAVGFVRAAPSRALHKHQPMHRALALTLSKGPQFLPSSQLSKQEVNKK